MRNLERNDTNELTYKIEIDSEISEWNYCCGGRGKGCGEGIVWNRHIHTALFKTDKQQGPTEIAQGTAQYYVAAWMGGELGGKWIHAYVYLKLSQHCKSAILQYKTKPFFKKRIFGRHLAVAGRNQWSTQSQALSHYMAPLWCVTGF